MPYGSYQRGLMIQTENALHERSFFAFMLRIYFARLFRTFILHVYSARLFCLFCTFILCVYSVYSVRLFCAFILFILRVYLFILRVYIVENAVSGYIKNTEQAVIRLTCSFFCSKNLILILIFLPNRILHIILISKEIISVQQLSIFLLYASD